MAKVNPMHSNMLACYPYVIKRLQTIDSIKKVAEAGELNFLLNKKQRPDDNTLYVILYDHPPTETNNANKEQFIELDFIFVLVKRYFKNKIDYLEVGKTLTEIMHAMQGFEPLDDNGCYLVTEPFKQAKPLPIRFEDGYVFFSTRFIAEVAIINHDNCNQQF